MAAVPEPSVCWCSLLLLCTLGAVLCDRDKFDANNFLEKFGYLDDLAPGQTGHSESSTTNAVQEFQRFNGLPVTGRLDRETVRKMQQPRCGLPDVIKPSQRPASLRGRPDRLQPLPFYALGYKWQKKDLTYKIVGYTSKLDGNLQSDAFRNAFQKWANVVPLNFRKVTSGSADMEISFARGQHNDGPGNAFDGRGGTLAHAFFPGDVAIAGDTHFDDDELWTLGTQEGTNLEIVAAHEFGHALGLGHSNVPTALMAPYYQGYNPKYSLNRDDIAGIESLYGRGRGSVAGSSDGRNTAAPEPSTTSAPQGPYCDLKIDALAENSDGSVYLFRGSMVYRLDSRGIVDSQRITAVFPEAPSSPAAAVYDRYRRQLFIFKGQRYWRYTNNRLDPGYPRTLPSDFQNAQAALQWSDGGIYLFSNDMYMRWAEGLTSFSNGYPRSISSYWPRAPTNIEAALQSQDGYYYFFKGTRYWKYNSRAQLLSGYPKDIRPAWLSCGPPQPR